MMDFCDFHTIYDSIIGECRALFVKKLADYGPTWLFFRDSSFIDQLWIKIKRIRTLEENNDRSSVGEGREGEFIGLINYGIIMLAKQRFPDILPASEDILENVSVISQIPDTEIFRCYDSCAAEIRVLMEKKNHDYGAAWTQMHPHSITDQIIIKIFRIKNIAANDGKVTVSENIDAQLMDIVNYSIFGLIMARKL